MCFSNTTESCLCFRFLAFPVFETPVSRMLAWENALLHGIAAAIGVSNFRFACLMMSLYSSSLGSNRINSTQFSGMFEFWFLDCPFLSPYSLRGFSNSYPSVKSCVMSFGFLSVSLWTTYILSEEFRSIM